MTKLLLLVLLLLVLAWRVHSCQEEVALKRAQAERQADREGSRAAQPSRFPLNPIARRAAMADAHRLQLDRRFLRALERVAEMTGTRGASASARFEQGAFQLECAETRLGAVPELPDFEELMPPLLAFAKARLAKAPLAGAPLPAALEPLQWETEALQMLPDALAHSANFTPATLHNAARAAVALSFYLHDTLETADALQSDALAFFALDRAASGGGAGEEAALAAALGYGHAAASLAQQLPGDGSLKAYLLADDARLDALAKKPGAAALDRYLAARRALDRHDQPRTEAIVDAGGKGDLSLAMLGQLLRQREQARFEPAAEALPLFILASARGVPMPESGTPAGVLPRLLEQLGVPAEAISPAVEAALGELDADTAAYRRAFWGSALKAQADFWLEAQGNRNEARSFSDALAGDRAPFVQQFQRWLSATTSLLETSPAEAFATLDKLPAFGGAAAAALLSRASGRANFSDPKLLRAVDKVVVRLDTRPVHRELFGRAAWNDLQDLALAEKLDQSAVAADPARFEHVAAFLARLQGDARELSRIGSDKSQLESTRSDALEALFQLGGPHQAEAEQAFRGLMADYPLSFHVPVTLARQLRLARRYDDGAALMRRYIEATEGRTSPISVANARGTLGLYLYLAGKYEEGYRESAPALPVGNAAGYIGAALNLAGLGRAAEARQVAVQLIQRYPYPYDIGRAAQVEWKLGDLEAAAKLLGAPPSPLTEQDFQKEIAEPFVEQFAARPPAEAVAAVKALARRGVEPWNRILLAFALDKASAHEAASQIFEAVAPETKGPQRAIVAIEARGALRSARGEAFERAWVKDQLGPIDPGMARNLALVGFRENVPEVAWELVPDPLPGDRADTVWLLRAASVALLGDAAPAARRTLLKQHFAVADGKYYSQLTRYLVGLVPQREMAALVTDSSSACEVPYYFGVRAQGEERFADAADWYRVALECGMPNEAEYAFAQNALYRWRSEKDPFGRLHR